MAGRDSYAEVGRAMRVSLEAALRADPELSAGAWRVLAAIIHEVPTWSRISDTVARKKLADLTGLTERTVSRAVNRLVAAGAIKWTPGDGAGNASQVALPIERETDRRPPYEQERETDGCPPLIVKGGQSSVQKGRHRPPVKRPTTRRVYEKKPRARERADNTEEQGARHERVRNDCLNPECIGGHVLNDKGDAVPCPSCRPDVALVTEPASTGERR